MANRKPTIKMSNDFPTLDNTWPNDAWKFNWAHACSEFKDKRQEALKFPHLSNETLNSGRQTNISKHTFIQKANRQLEHYRKTSNMDDAD
jgi:hypothetical protein